MKQVQDSYTEEDAKEVREIESELEERFRSKDVSAKEVKDGDSIGVGAVVGVSKNNSKSVCLEIRPEGQDESFSETVKLPSERDEMDNEWNRLCAYLGLNDPSSVRSVWYQKVPICRPENGKWGIDFPPERKVTSLSSFKFRRLAHSVGFLNLEAGGYEPSKKLILSAFIANCITTLVALNSVAGFEHWDDTVSEMGVGTFIWLLSTSTYAMFGVLISITGCLYLGWRFFSWLNKSALGEPW